MNFYKNRRYNSGLSRGDVAHELGISYKKYEDIERGKVKMPNNLINKFNEIITRGKNVNKLTSTQRDVEINEWFNDIRASHNGVPKIKDLMNEYNIATYKQLSNLLGISLTYLSTTLNASNNNVGQNMKARLFDFFHNELNIQPLDELVYHQSSGKNQRDYKLSPDGKIYLDWWNNFDLKKYLKDNNIKQKELAKATGINRSTVCRMCDKNKHATPYLENTKKIKAFVDNYKKDDMKELKEQMPELPSNDTDPIKTTVIMEDFHDVVEQIKEDDSAINVIKNKVDFYLNKLEGLEYEIVKLNEQIDEHKKEVQSLTNKKDALIDILNDLESEE